MKQYLLKACALLGLMMLAGCVTPLGVDKVSPRTAYQLLHENALESDYYSPEARHVLHRYDLEQAFEKNPVATLTKLQALAVTDERRDLLYALCELNFLNAEQQGSSVKPGVRRLARDSYFASAIYAYLYLFGAGTEAPPSPFDVRFRAASDFYNRGLAQGLVIGTNALVQLAGGIRQTPAGVVAMRFTQPVFPWQLEQVQGFYASDEFIVRGLSTRNRDSGLGAPLIVVLDKFGRFSETRRMPATVFLRVNGNVRDWISGKMSATLELYSTFQVNQVTVNGERVPLQTDTTAPIAQGLSHSFIWDLAFAQFFSAKETTLTGTRLMEPYIPGRIPLVFVHGTASSPAWWAEMYNTLRADPVLRERYQFWMFNYASGNPISYTAGILRNDLMNEIKQLDPDGHDEALQHMVIVGHSQGGLLAKLTATDTGDKLLQLLSNTNIDTLDIDPQACDLLRSNLCFKPLPCVSRVIFIATPHRGSYQNSDLVQKFLGYFMEFQSDVLDATASLLRFKDKIQLPPAVLNGVPSSLNGMATNNAFILALADMPVAANIKANSIIAINSDEQPPNGSDGVVSYTSAHVSYAESEFIVRSGHSCQANPLVIEEMRRILLENLRPSAAVKASLK